MLLSKGQNKQLFFIMNVLTVQLSSTMSNVSLVCVNHPPAGCKWSFLPARTLEDDAISPFKAV